jgi:DNA-binding transcriptional LysR family regulator
MEMTTTDPPQPEPLLEPLNLHLQQLRYLLAVERGGTFTAAAGELHISQPALSQSLAELERRLGARLFERDGRRRRLTAAGAEVARFAAEVIGRGEELRQSLAAQEQGRSGTLNIGMIDAASLYLLPPAIEAYRQERPDVQLRIAVDDSAALLARLQRFELDLVVVVGEPADGAAWTELHREPLFRYAWADADEPLRDEWLVYAQGSQTRALIDEGLRRAGVEARVTLESHNPSVLRQMAALGLGWTVLPAPIAEEHETPLRRHGRQPVAERTISAALRGSASPDPRAAAFVELAREAIAAMGERAS